jgi:hypothetical protein
MSVSIRPIRSQQVNRIMEKQKSLAGLPFRDVLSTERLSGALEKLTAFRDRIFSPCGDTVGFLVSGNEPGPVLPRYRR